MESGQAPRDFINTFGLETKYIVRYHLQPHVSQFQPVSSALGVRPKDEEGNGICLGARSAATTKQNFHQKFHSKRAKRAKHITHKTHLRSAPELQ